MSYVICDEDPQLIARAHSTSFPTRTGSSSGPSSGNDRVPYPTSSAQPSGNDNPEEDSSDSDTDLPSGWDRRVVSEIVEVGGGGVRECVGVCGTCQVCMCEGGCCVCMCVTAGWMRMSRGDRHKSAMGGG